MNTKYIFGLIAAIIVIGSLVFFLERNTKTATPQSDHAEKKIRVVASFYPLYFFSQKIGGDRAEVVNITPAGAEPHDFEPTAGDIAMMERAQLIILNGGGLEAWGDRVLENNNAHTTVVIAGEGLTTQQIVEDGETMTDPHVWLSPVLAQHMVERIEQGFINVDPDNAAYYKMNARTLLDTLSALDTAYRDGLRACASKDIVTSHAAFGYLAAAYGLNQVSIAGLSPDAEPSPKQLADIAQFATSHRVRYIFFESLVSPKLSQTIAREVGAQTLTLDPIEGLSDDDSAAGKDYVTLMRDNLAHLTIALQCMQ